MDQPGGRPEVRFQERTQERAQERAELRWSPPPRDGSRDGAEVQRTPGPPGFIEAAPGR